MTCPQFFKLIHFLESGMHFESITIILPDEPIVYRKLETFGRRSPTIYFHYKHVHLMKDVPSPSVGLIFEPEVYRMMLQVTISKNM